MYKKIFLILFMISPMIKYLINPFCFGEGWGEPFAQVIIKDEIVLDEKNIYETENPDTETLPMPFYGRVYSEIPCYTGWSGGPLIIERRAGNQSNTWVCSPTFVCGSGSCGCIGTRALNFYNVTSGAEIYFDIQRCYAPPPVPPGVYEWYNVPLNFTYIGSNEYAIYGMDLADNSWDYIGYLKFYSETPPGNCPNAGGNYCDSPSWMQVPDVKLELNPNSNTLSKHCLENSSVLASFVPDRDHLTNLLDLTESNVIACYNQILQTWQFNLDQDIKIYYQIGICSTNVSTLNLTYINSLSDVNSTIIPSTRCNDAKKSFDAHKDYKYDYTSRKCVGLGIPIGGYIIKEVIDEHEKQHKISFEQFMNDYKFLWEVNINTFRASCLSIADIFEARKVGLKMYWDSFFAGKYYFLQFYNEYNRLHGLSPVNEEIKCKYEQITNNTKEVQDLIIQYKRKLSEICGN
jgi:hypothetical protein